MQKIIIAAAMAGCSLPAAAEVKLYGQIKSSISTGRVSIEGGAGTEKSPVLTRINDNTSRIGISGREELGGGLAAIWQIEQRTPVLGNGGQWGTRDSFIGLEGRLGKIRAGNLNNQLNEMDTVDLWMYSSNAAGLGVYVRTGSRRISLRYDTPKLGGFSANLQVAPRDNENPADSSRHDEATRAQYNAGLNYETGGFFAKLGYNFKKNSHSGGRDGHTVRLESGHTAGKLFLGMGLQHARGSETGNQYIAHFTNGFNGYNGNAVNEDPAKEEGVKVTDAILTASYKLGNWKPTAGYAHGWAARGLDSGGILVDKFDQIILGTDYLFSKRTAVRSQIGHMRTGGQTRLGGGQTGKIRQTAAQIGLHHRF